MQASFLNGAMPLLLPLILIFSMYFMVYLPQKKREKKTNEMLKQLQEGVDVVTIGGVVGKIVNIKDNELTIETSVEKTQLKIMRWAVREVVNKAS